MYEYQAIGLANRLLAKNNLSNWTVEVTDESEYLGKCVSAFKRIRLSRPLLLGGKYPDSEVEETILHEIAHALTPGEGHGLKWRDKLLEIGGKCTEAGKCNDRATAKGRATTKLKEKCPDCGRRAIQSKREIIYLGDDEIAIDVTDQTEHIPTSKTVVLGEKRVAIGTPDPNDLLSAALAGGKKKRTVVTFGHDGPKVDGISEASPSPESVGTSDVQESSPQHPRENSEAYSFTNPINIWEDDGGPSIKRTKAIRITLQCGHFIIEPLIEEEADFSEFVAIDLCHAHKQSRCLLEHDLETENRYNGRKVPYSYQVQCVEFARDNNFCALFNLDMGLGKTIIMCMLLWKYAQLRPALIICNSTLVANMCYELYRWAGIFAQRITSAKDKPHPDLFNVFVTTYDLAGKIDWDSYGVRFSSIFLDECQKIKSQATNRTQAIINLIQSQSIQHRMFMSNTPIKNNAGEYFVSLNLLDQYQFPNRNWFVDDYCDTWYDGRFKKVGGIRRNRQEQFMEATKHFIIRFTRPEVLPDLPPVVVQNKFVEIDKDLKKAHDKAAEEFMDAFYAAEGEEDPIAAAAMMQSSIFKLKHIVGLGKVKPCIEWVEEFLEEYPGEKIVIFAHHLDVMDLIFAGISQKCEELGIEPPMTLSNIKAEDRFDRINKFRDSKSPVLIAPTLSCGEGINLQFAHWGMLLERQWNPANEMQVHGRFSRPGQQAKEVFMILLIALDSTDQYLTEIVEQKFDYVSSALGDNIEVQWNERSVIQQLAAKILSKGRKVA